MKVIDLSYFGLMAHGLSIFRGHRNRAEPMRILEKHLPGQILVGARVHATRAGTKVKDLTPWSPKIYPEGQILHITYPANAGSTFDGLPDHLTDFPQPYGVDGPRYREWMSSHNGRRPATERPGGPQLKRTRRRKESFT